MLKQKNRNPLYSFICTHAKVRVREDGTALQKNTVGSPYLLGRAPPPPRHGGRPSGGGGRWDRYRYAGASQTKL